MKGLGLFSIGMVLLLVAGCESLPPVATPTNLPTATQVSAKAALPATFTAPPPPSATASAVIPAAPSLRPTVTQIVPTPTSALRVTPKAGAQCPFNIPVGVVAPGPETSGFDWSSAIQPMDDPCVDKIVVDPRDEQLWYVSGQNGLYITRNGGGSWEHPLTRPVQTLALSPDNPNLVYAAQAQTLYLSSDQGNNWKSIHNFDVPITSLTINRDGTVYLGANWGASATANGIYVSPDRGANWELLPFTPSQKGLVTWDIQQDSTNGMLYVGSEIYNHPQPYRPPFFLSKDQGRTWDEISRNTTTATKRDVISEDAITWHVIKIQINPQNGYVYALTEGPGLYGSADHGEHWRRLGGDFGLTLLLDSNYPNRLFGGEQQSRAPAGGVFLSIDGGARFTPIGLHGIKVTSISLNGGSTELYVASYASGIYHSRIPANAFPR